MNSLRTPIGILLILAGSTPVFAQQTVNTELPAAAAMSDSMANPTTPATGAFQAAWDGSVWKRMTFGSAGTASSQVWTIQGIASMTPVLVTLSGTNTVQPGNTANTTPWLFSLSQGGNTAAVTASSTLKVTNYNSSGTELIQDTQAQHDTAMGTVTSVTGGFSFGRASAAAPTDVSADGDAVLPWHLRNGAQVMQLSAAGTLIGATSTSLNVNCTGGCSGGTQYADGAAWSAGNSGTSALAVRQDSPAALTGVAAGDWSPLQVDSSGMLYVRAAQQSAWEFTSIAGTAGGASNYRIFQTSGAVIAAQIKGSAGQVYDISCFNTHSAAAFVRLYNVTGTPATSDTPVWSGIIPPTNSGFTPSFPVGRVFGTGIGIRVTGAIADNDATALTANTVMCNVGYK